jgi:hypothetical protein
MELIHSPRVRSVRASHKVLERGIELLKDIHLFQQVEMLQEIEISRHTRLLL